MVHSELTYNHLLSYREILFRCSILSIHITDKDEALGESKR
jgi:hypothetical protein